MVDRMADRFLPDRDDEGRVDDPNDTKLFGNDEQGMPRMPGHPASSAAGESPGTMEEQAREFGMNPGQDAEAGGAGSEAGAGPFNLDKVDDLKRELRDDDGDRR